MKTKPKFWNYIRSSGKNYGLNSLAFEDTDKNIFYFSYDTLIAFKHKNKLYVIKNYWKTTTGKHLNEIDKGDKKNRLEKEEFDKIYAKLFGDK